MLYPDSCQCNKYCVKCWNNIERKQMTAVWRSWHDKLGLWWSVAVVLEDCHVIHCELWKYQDSNKLRCWLERRNIYIGRIKIYDITGDRLFHSTRSISWKVCKGLGDIRVRRTSKVCSNGCWNENLAGYAFWNGDKTFITFTGNNGAAATSWPVICCGLNISHTTLIIFHLFIFLNTASALQHVKSYNCGYFSGLWPYNSEFSVCKDKGPLWNS